MSMNTAEENYRFLEIENQKLKRDTFIMKRDMRILQKELQRIYRACGSKEPEAREIGSLLQLIRLLKQR